MSVIVELTVPANALELGQILCAESSTRVILESVVPLGQQQVLFVRVKNDCPKTFQRTISEHCSVRNIHLVTTHTDQQLYAVEWAPPEHSLIWILCERDIILLSAIGTMENWKFELRFPTHDSLSSFREYCADENVRITVTRMYNTTVVG